MSIETYYVKAKSKKEINARLEKEEAVYATNYKMGETKTVLLNNNNMLNGDVIKIYEKIVGGSPYAKAYGNWDAKKQRVK